MTFKTRAGMLAAALGLAVAFPAASYASDGTLNFTGAVSSTTCTITAGTDNLLTVALPPVSVSSLADKTKLAGYTSFTINLGGCPEAANSAHAFFESGPQVDATTGNLKNTATGSAATLVQVGLFNTDRTAIPLNKDDTGQKATEVTLTKTGTSPAMVGTGALTYLAGYVPTGKATAGKFSSSVTYTVVYR